MTPSLRLYSSHAEYDVYEWTDETDASSNPHSRRTTYIVRVPEIWDKDPRFKFID